jgi:hypothetical protein
LEDAFDLHPHDMTAGHMQATTQTKEHVFKQAKWQIRETKAFESALVARWLGAAVAAQHSRDRLPEGAIFRVSHRGLCPRIKNVSFLPRVG